MKKRVGALIFGVLGLATLGSAEDWMLGPFRKAETANPILGPADTMFDCPVRGEPVGFEAKDVFNPAAVVREGKVYLLYRAEDRVGHYKGTSRIGIATSDDGLHFTREGSPVLYPDNDEFKKWEWEGGCEDPRIVEDEEGTYYLTYSAYDGKKSRLFIATSADLRRWRKYGSVFGKAYGGKYREVWSKSGSIVCRQEGERLVAARIRGRYWMYWGDSNIYLAWSDNLIDWTPVRSERVNLPSWRSLDKLDLEPVFKPRPGKFDSILVEPGPPAILTARGILLLYNGANSSRRGDPRLKHYTYAAGQTLLDSQDPGRVIARSEGWFLAPDRDYEIAGQVNNVCFIEGLVFFQGRWILYYGTADSKIAAAVSALDPGDD